MKLKRFFSILLCFTLFSSVFINISQVDAREATRYETTGTLQSNIRLTTDRKMYNNISGYPSRLRAVTVNGVSVPAFCADFNKIGSVSLTQEYYSKNTNKMIDESTPYGRAIIYAVQRGYSNDNGTMGDSVDNRYYATQLAIWKIQQNYGKGGANWPSVGNSSILTKAKDLYNRAIEYATNYDNRNYQLYPSIHGATASSTISSATKAANQGYYEIPLTLQSRGYEWMQVTVSGGNNVKIIDATTGSTLANENTWKWTGLDPLLNSITDKKLKIRVDVPDSDTNVTVKIESDNAVYNPRMYIYDFKDTSRQSIFVPLFEVNTKKFYKQYTYKLEAAEEEEEKTPITYIPKKNQPEDTSEPEPEVTTTGTLTIYKTDDKGNLLSGAELALRYNESDNLPTSTFNLIPIENGHFYYCGDQSLGSKELPGKCQEYYDENPRDMYAATWKTGANNNNNGLISGTGIMANPIIIEGLPTGNYIISENKRPDGYLSGIASSNSEKLITVNEGKNEIYIENIKQAKGSVKISKQDTTTGKELPGATLKLVKDDGNCSGDIIAEWESTDKPYEITDLSDGTYCLTETMAPEGFDKSEETVKITISDGKSAGTVVMKNSPSKVDNPKNPETSDLNFVLIGGFVIIAVVAAGYSIIKLRKQKEMVK